MVFRNPSNDHVETIDNQVLWFFLFGPFYLAYKGLWGHAVLSFILAVITVGISQIVYLFLVTGLIRKHYLHKGWKEEVLVTRAVV